jgi:myosin heavy subunit
LYIFLIFAPDLLRSAAIFIFLHLKMVKARPFFAYIGFVAAMTLLGCEPKVQETPEYLALQQRSDSLLRQISAKDQEVEDVAAIVNEIEGNLAAIQKDQASINDLKKEGAQMSSQKDRINEMIAGIDNYMEQNRQRIAKLEGQAKKGGAKAAALQKLIDQLRTTLDAKELELTQLRTSIDSLAEVNTGLRQAVAERDVVISRKDSALKNRQKDILDRDTEMNWGYFVFGPREDLMESSIIDRKGSIFKKTSILNGQVDKSKFTQIDVRKVDDINLGITKHKNVVTPHPAESYYIALVGQEAHLKITDYKRFWSTSRYLVVETD